MVAPPSFVILLEVTNTYVDFFLLAIQDKPEIEPQGVQAFQESFSSAHP